MSRWEDAPDLRAVIRLIYAMVDLYCASYARPPRTVTLDIDDTVDIVHGHQQLSLFNAHYDERCFLPIHVYDTTTSRPVAVQLRPGTTPSGVEIRNHLRRLVRRIRQHWPHTRLTMRGDGHYGRPEVMAWCEANGVDYILGLPGNKVLDRLVEPAADDVRVRLAEAQGPCDPPLYRGPLRRQILALRAARCCTHRGDHQRPRYPLCRYQHRPGGNAEWLYDTLYCARGQAENLIKLHKTQLASDRTSCRSPRANQVRLVLHTRAYWLMLGLRDAHSEAAAPGPRRVHHLADTLDQDRRPHRRDRQPGADCLRSRTSRGSAVHQFGPLSTPRRTVTQRASAPNSPRPLNPQRLPDMVRSAVKKTLRAAAFAAQRAAAASSR